MSLIELANRKKLELEQKMNALETEFEIWFEKSRDANGKFAKHHTQIRAIRAMLEPRHAEIRQELNAFDPNAATADFLGNCANNGELILSEHRIWNYFRNKFIQRNEDTFDLYLKAADEFAWECYRPVRETVYPDPTARLCKEPPLVFFNGGASPFAVSRDRSFEPEAVSGGIALDAETVGKLPIPVIGIPWHQVTHLPEILVVGHEVGHLIEKDFDLTAELEAHLQNALEEANAGKRAQAWQSWRGEIFADLYGCLAGGAAYAGTLIDFVAKNPKTIFREARNFPAWGKYPTVWLRVRIILKALDLMNFGNETQNYKKLWENFDSQMPAEFANDIETVVPALLDGALRNLGGVSIRKVFDFTAAMQMEVEKTVIAFGNIRPNKKVPLPTDKIRILFAALRWAFERQPAEYVQNQYSRAVLSFIESDVLKPGLRSGEKQLSEAAVSDRVKNYGETGAELLRPVQNIG